MNVIGSKPQHEFSCIKQSLLLHSAKFLQLSTEEGEWRYTVVTEENEVERHGTNVETGHTSQGTCDCASAQNSIAHPDAEQPLQEIPSALSQPEHLLWLQTVPPSGHNQTQPLPVIDGNDCQ